MTLFQFGRTVRCPCGETVVFEHRQEAPLTYSEIFNVLAEAEKREAETIKRMADRISSLIVASDYPLVDIEIEMERLKEKCAELFPDSLHLYHLIYESRFKRLWVQFRNKQ